MIPTPRMLLAMLAASAAAGLLLLLAGSLGLLLAILLLLLPPALLILDLRRLAPAASVSAKVEAPGLLYLGSTDPGSLTISQAGRRPLQVSAILDVTGVLEPLAVLALRLPAGGEPVTVPLALKPLRRGEAGLSRLWLRWSGPLGLIQRQSVRPVEREIGVLPDFRSLTEGQIALHLREIMAGLRVQRDRAQGTEFDALREFHPGMDSRFIDWKASARHRALLTRTFQMERNHPVVFSFDAGWLMQEDVGGLPRLDRAINAALPLAWLALHEGDLVGLHAFGAKPQRWLAPGRGHSAFAALRKEASAIAYRAEETNFTLGLTDLASRLNRRALILLFTEFIDTTAAQLMIEDLQPLAKRHLLLFISQRHEGLNRLAEAEPVSPIAYGAAALAEDALTERAKVLSRMRRMGIMVLDSPADSLPLALLNLWISLKQQALA